MRLRVTRDGEVVVTVPEGVPDRVVEKFLSDKEEWIQKMREKQKDFLVINL